MNEDAIRTLNDLIHLDVDAIHAYQQALDACETQEIKDRLGEFKGDHERHVTDLSAMVRKLGGEPAEGRDIKGFFIEGFTAIMSRGDRTALLSMRGNEELTTSRYGAARKMNVSSSEAMEVIERNYQDEVRHLSWIKDAIKARAWEEGPGREKAA
jgi:uncharacterized protein (TIGR02284 family)